MPAGVDDLGVAEAVGQERHAPGGHRLDRGDPEGLVVPVLTVTSEAASSRWYPVRSRAPTWTTRSPRRWRIPSNSWGSTRRFSAGERQPERHPLVGQPVQQPEEAVRTLLPVPAVVPEDHRLVGGGWPSGVMSSSSTPTGRISPLLEHLVEPWEAAVVECPAEQHR